MAVTDRGWAWVVLVSGFVSCVIFDGIIYSSGIFFMEFLDYFKEGRLRTAWIGSTLNAIAHLAGPLASILVARAGCRVTTALGSLLAACGFFVCTFSSYTWMVVVTYGVVAGVGFSMMFLCAYTTIGFWFEKRRALATGLVSCGSGVGAFIFAPLSLALIEAYGWKGAMWIVSGLALNGVVVAFTYCPIQPRLCEQNGEKTTKTSSVFAILISPAFIVIFVSLFLINLVFFIPYLYLPDVALSLGIPVDRGSLLISVIGIANIIGRLVAGCIADKPWAKPMLLNIVSLVVLGAAHIARVWMTSYATLMIYSALIGVATGVHVAVVPLILFELGGPHQLAHFMGIVNFGRGVSTLIGPPLAGYLYDISGNYDVAFYTTGGVMATAGVLCIPLLFCQPFKRQRIEPAIELNPTSSDSPISIISSRL